MRARTFSILSFVHAANVFSSSSDVLRLTKDAGASCVLVVYDQVQRHPR
jgi:hypothetical protein